MSTETAKASTERPSGSRTVRHLAVFLGCYSLFLLWCFAPAISSPDDNGYFTQGTLLATTGRTWFTPESPVQYVGVHWLLTPGDRYFSRHSPGLSVPVAVISRLAGPEAAVALNPALAVLGVLGVFLLARRVLPDRWSLAAAVLVAVNPSYTAHAIVCDAHMAVTVLLVWGLFLLLHWRDGAGIVELFGAGLLLGCIPAVRAPEAIYAVGIAAFLVLHVAEFPKTRPHALAALAGAAIPVAMLMLYNHVSFGAFWRTAYSFTGEQSGFTVDHLLDHLARYLRDLLSMDGVGPFLVLGVAGASVMCGRPRMRSLGVAILLLVVPTTILYMAYYWAPQGPPVLTVRFLLPTFPLYFIGGLWLVLQMRATRARRVTAAAVIGLQLLWAGPLKSLPQSRFLHHQKEVLAAAAAALDAHVERGSVVIARQTLLQHLDYLRRWRLADAATTMSLPLLNRLEEQLAHTGAHVLQPEKLRARSERYRNLGTAELEEAFAHDVVEWAGAAPVYYIGTIREIDGMPGAWLHPENLEVIARAPMPEPPPVVRRLKTVMERRLAARGLRRVADRPPSGTGEDSTTVPEALSWILGDGGAPEAGMQRLFDLLDGAGEIVIARWTPVRREPAQEPHPTMWRYLW